jgi:hypothetical protein
MAARSPRVWVVDIRNEISGIRELTPARFASAKADAKSAQ